jgi:ABC-type nitrate/sulfonate/bicarbonate transport system permease component
VIATAGGVDNVPRGLIRMGQSFGLSRWSIIRKIVLPAGNLYDTDNLLAGIVVLSVLGLLVSWVIGRLERWFLA